LWLLLTDRRARAVQADWERNAHQMVAAFRGRLAENKEDPTFADLADRLHQASPEFRRWWPRQDVLYERSIALETDHPELGRLTFSATTLRPEVAPLLRLLVWTPADDTPTRARLRQIVAGR
ncbi:MAG TPA: hypothetical protein VGI06_17475, partial [Acidimicrobiales bacterium]